MRRLTAAAARFRAAAAAAAARAWSSRIGARACTPPTILGPVLPCTPRFIQRQPTSWRPRINPQLRTVRERVIIYYLSADVPVAATLALAGWPVGASL